jgi:hypothetical protein
MSWASITYTFSPSTIAKASEVNQNFSDVVAGLNKAMPSGGIILWSGSIASIPVGYYLCDGNNATPNLVGKFVQGAGSGYAVGAVGGSATHQHAGVDHLHYDDHYHNVIGNTGGTFDTDIVRRGSSDPFYLSNSSHTHNIAIASATKSSMGYGSYTNGSDRDLTSGSTDTRPPFLTLAYIMKS